MSLALEWRESQRPGEREGEERRRRESKQRQTQRARENMRKSRRNRLLFCGFLLSALLVSGILIFCVFLHVMVVQNEIRTRELERQIDLERRQQEDMRTEIASLESPGRIEKIAAEKLKMAQVTRVEYLWSPSFKALKSGEKSKLSDGEAMYSDAKRGAERQN